MTNGKIKIYCRQNGLTLIELMVSLVIGLLLAIIASSTYLYSKQAYNAVSENSQMEENGRLALNLLTRNIQAAGYTIFDREGNPPGATEIKLAGCEVGMLNPTGATAASDLSTCLTSTPAGVTQSGSIAMFYQTDAFNTSGGSFQGVDCIGNKPVEVSSPTGIFMTSTFQVRSYFFVSNTTVATPGGTTTMGQLSCATDPTGGITAGTFQRQPLIPGVHQLRARYILPEPTDPRNFAPGQKIYESTALTADQWKRVVEVDLCVLTKSIQPSGNDTAASVIDCYGNTFTPPQSQSYRRFTTTVNLRNRTDPPT